MAERPSLICYGAGAIGLTVGGWFAAAGYRVTFIGRESTVNALRTRGLTVDHAHGGAAVRLPPLSGGRLGAYPSLKAVAAAGLEHPVVLSAVKGYDAATVLDDVAAQLGDDTPIICLQNGAGHEEAALHRLKRAPIGAGSVTMSVSVLGPGHVRVNNRGGLVLAPVRGQLPLEDLAASLAEQGVRATLDDDYRAMKWSKLISNMIANATCAITGMSPQEVLSHPATFSVERRAFGEARAVVGALGLTPRDLPGVPVRLLDLVMRRLPAPLARPIISRRAGSGRGHKAPSLQLDALAGKTRSEVVYLNGAVARSARECGLEAPVNEALCRLLLRVIGRPEERGRFHGCPAALARAVTGPPAAGSGEPVPHD